MPAGDLITDLWQHEVNGYMFGDSNPYGILKVSGWFGRSVRGQDVDLDTQAGSVATTDTQGPRLITIELEDRTATNDDEALEHFLAFEEAWAIGGDVELHTYLPALGRVYVVGRCRDVPPPAFDELIVVGRYELQAMFLAGDPTIHETPEV